MPTAIFVLVPAITVSVISVIVISTVTPLAIPTAHCDIAGASVGGARIPREVRVASVLPVHCCSRSPLWLHAIASWCRQSGDYSHHSHRLLHGARQQKAPTLPTSLLEVVVRTTFRKLSL